LADHPNAVVLRTLSKAYGLAGARCGSAIGHPELIALLQKVRAPYPISSPSLAAVLEAIDVSKESEARRGVLELVISREKLALELAELPCVTEVFPSRANYLLFKTTGAGKVMAACRKQGIVLRDRSADHGLKDCVRVTLGTADENARVIEALRGVENGAR
jgi:histidinol-phosphate aminotransferase